MGFKLSNIIGAPFRAFVTNQLIGRAKRNAKKNRTLQDVSYFANPTAWVKLSSSVKVTPTTPERESYINVLKNTYADQPDSFLRSWDGDDGKALAKNWILYAGTSKLDSNGDIHLRSGIDGYDSAYTLGGTSQQGYRPMPGITSVSVETAGRLGSLRYATIDFKVWNMQQLDVIDALYFRLGFTMLLEWGHTTYFLKPESTDLVRDEGGITSFFDEDITKEQLQQEINVKVAQSRGNYDAMLGVVCNFNYSYNQEGGWDCSIKLIGLGSLMETQKINLSWTMPDKLKEAWEQYKKVVVARIKKEEDEKYDALDRVAINNANTTNNQTNQTYLKQFNIQTFNDLVNASALSNQTAPSDKAYQLSKQLIKTYTIDPTADTQGRFIYTPTPYYYYAANKLTRIYYGDWLDRTNLAFSTTVRYLPTYKDYPLEVGGKAKVSIRELGNPLISNLLYVYNDVNANVYYNRGNIRDFGWLDKNLDAAGYGNAAAAAMVQTVSEDDGAAIPQAKFENQYLNLEATAQGVPVDLSIKVADLNKNYIVSQALQGNRTINSVPNNQNIYGYSDQQYGGRVTTQVPVTSRSGNTITIRGTINVSSVGSTTAADAMKTVFFLAGNAPASGGGIANWIGGSEYDKSIAAGYTRIKMTDLALVVQSMWAEVDSGNKMTITDIGTFTESSSNARIVQVTATYAARKKINMYDSNNNANETEVAVAVGLTTSLLSAFTYAEPSPASGIQPLGGMVSPNLVQRTYPRANIEQANQGFGLESALEAILTIIKYKAISKTINSKAPITKVTTLDTTGIFLNSGSGSMPPLAPAFKETQNGWTIDYTKEVSNIDAAGQILTDPLSLGIKGYNTTLMQNYNYDPESGVTEAQSRKARWDEIPSVDFEKLCNAYIIGKNPFQTASDTHDYSSIDRPVFISFGYLVMLLNSISLLYDTTKSSKGTVGDRSLARSIFYIDFNPETNFCLTIPAQLSIDPSICLIPFSGTDDDYKNLFISKDLQPDSNTIFTKSKDKISSTIKQTAEYVKDNQYRAKTMDILLNIGFLLDIIKSTADRDAHNDVYLQPFLERIVTEVNKSLGDINALRISYQDEGNTVAIVDDQLVPPADKEKEENVIFTDATGKFIMPVYGPESLVRDFGFQTDISTKMSSMIAIGAQAANKGSTQSTDASHYYWLNLGLTDRVIEVKENSSKPGATTNNNGKQKQKEDPNKLLADKFNAHVNNVYGDGQKFYKELTDPARNFLIQSATRVKAEDKVVSGAMAIPLNPSFTTMGISGIIMGNGFLLPKGIIPITLRGTETQHKYGFIVMGLQHRIEGNEWVTSVKGQIVKNVSDKVIKPLTPSTTSSTTSNSTNNTPSNPPIPAGNYYVGRGTGLEPLKDVISSHESRGDYTVYLWRKAADSYGASTATRGGYSDRYYLNDPRRLDITKLTLLKICELSYTYGGDNPYGYDSPSSGPPGPIFVTGRYQNKSYSLISIGKKIWGDNWKTVTYSPENQEKIFEYIILERQEDLGKYLKGENDGTKEQLEAAVQEMAQEWSALPTIKNKSGIKYGDVETGTSRAKYYKEGGAASKLMIGDIVQNLIRARVNYSGKDPVYIPSYYDATTTRDITAPGHQTQSVNVPSSRKKKRRR